MVNRNIIGGLVALSLLSGCDFGREREVNPEIRVEKSEKNTPKDTKPLHRYHYMNFSGKCQDYFYSTSDVGGLFYANRGIEGYVFSEGKKGTLPLYQLENIFSAGESKSHIHIYTTDENEKEKRVKEGWEFKGISSYIFSQQVEGTVPFHRLLNGKDNSRLYTVSVKEKKELLKRGWLDEGIAGYIYPAEEKIRK